MITVLCPRTPFAAAALSAAMFLSAPAGAGEFNTAWQPDTLSRARMISGGMKDGIYHVGVEVSLKGNAHTYWRHPGDGGIPPDFNFKGSANLKQAKVLFPAPQRSGKPGEQIFGYGGEVVFPVQVVPKDPGKPVKLNLDFNYAACEKICVPAQAKLSLVLNPGMDNKNLLGRIRDYAALVPKPLAGAGAPKIALTPEKPGKVWTAKISPQPGKASDLFAEGPEGWFFDVTKAGPDTFRVTLAQKAPGARADAPLPDLRLTLVTRKGAWETVRPLAKTASGAK